MLITFCNFTFSVTIMLTCGVGTRRNPARSLPPPGGPAPENTKNSNRYSVIKNPSNPRNFNSSEFSNRYKTAFLLIRFAVLPALIGLHSRLAEPFLRRSYLPSAPALQYPATHTGEREPA